MLRLADERDRPCAEMRVVTSAHLRDVRAKIADLQAMERVLRATVARCARGTGFHCALIEDLFPSGPDHGVSTGCPLDSSRGTGMGDGIGGGYLVWQW